MEVDGCSYMAKGGRIPRRRNGRRQPRNFESVAGLPRAMTLSPNMGPIHKFSRTFGLALSKSAADQGFQVTFALSDLANFTEFQNLFMEWRIDSVQVHAVWTAATSIGPNPRIYAALDPVATTAPLSVAEIIQKKHTVWQTTPTSVDWVCIIKPRVTNLVATSPATGALVANSLLPANEFISTVSPSVGYGALQLFVGSYNTGLASSGTLVLNLTYNMSFRGLK